MAPKLTYKNRFHVDDSSDRFFTSTSSTGCASNSWCASSCATCCSARSGRRRKQPRDFVFLDLAQDLFPDKAQRDNDGDGLGLLYYDLLLRPRVQLDPVRQLLPRVLRRPRLAHRPAHVRHRAAVRAACSASTGRSRVPHRRAGRRRRRRRRRHEAVRALGPVRLAASATSISDEWLAYSFGLRRNDHDWSDRAERGLQPVLGRDDVPHRVPAAWALRARDRMGSDRCATRPTAH
jgi:hypothetical protein